LTCRGDGRRIVWPVESDREVDTVLRILILVAIIVALFLALPPTPAVAWSSVPFVLLAALLFDAYRRGRRLLLARQAEEKPDGAVDASHFLAGMMLFNAVWLGLDGGASAADGAYAHGLDGDFGAGFDAGGFGSDGGDSGAGGSF
jgi:uncharacterized membrane protein YgcG